MNSKSAGTPAGIDTASVGRWLAEQVPHAAPPFTYERIMGGHSNLTYLVTDRARRRYVLRRPPVGHLLATAHNVIREHDIMRAVAGSSVPVPRMLGACDDERITGAPFYVMEYVDGVVVQSDSDVEEFLPAPDARERAGQELIDALATLHRIDVDRAGLGELSRRSGYLERQLRRWAAQWAAAGLDEPGNMSVLHTWLVDHRPAEATPCLVHGDFRLGNAMVDRDGRLLAVLDWELCTLGEGLLDLAYFLRSWTEPDLRPEVARPPGRQPGFADGDDLIRRYAERSGRSVADLDYWRVFTAWRSAAILAGVYRRYLDGQLGARPGDLNSFRAEVVSRIQQGLAIARAVG